jgi:hypothetical protein
MAWSRHRDQATSRRPSRLSRVEARGEVVAALMRHFQHHFANKLVELLRLVLGEFQNTVLAKLGEKNLWKGAGQLACERQGPPW